MDSVGHIWELGFVLGPLTPTSRAGTLPKPTTPSTTGRAAPPKPQPQHKFGAATGGLDGAHSPQGPSCISHRLCPSVLVTSHREGSQDSASLGERVNLDQKDPHAHQQ